MPTQSLRRAADASNSPGSREIEARWTPPGEKSSKYQVAVLTRRLGALAAKEPENAAACCTWLSQENR
jgi:hypothetical protein